MHQLPLPINSAPSVSIKGPYRERLTTLLSEELDFHNQPSGYASHNLHSFPAKFPPQLPSKFIHGLTEPDEVVLDPMMGSGTTMVEAFLAGRRAVGFDIDPLARLVTRVKITPLDVEQLLTLKYQIVKQASVALQEQANALEQALASYWDDKTREFVDYWFARETQKELLALIREITKIEDSDTRAFFELVFSAIIITKSGGVSLALDLAHTRPHRAKVVLNKRGEIILGEDVTGVSPKRLEILTKTLRSPLEEFEKRFRQNFDSILHMPWHGIPPVIQEANAQSLPLDDNVIDLIVTSPPYASNAIDYMRAHKFSLVWMGYPIDELGQQRKEYIGGEAITDIALEALPTNTRRLVREITQVDEKKGFVLHRYYSEMTRVLREMFRVLRPGRAAIVVVGSSIMRGQDIEIHRCLAEIGCTMGFEVPCIGVRNLDRNRRMLPSGSNTNLKSAIQQRMHQEYVIGFLKPGG